jgi:hypothetical protein
MGELYSLDVDTIGRVDLRSTRTLRVRRASGEGWRRLFLLGFLLIADIARGAKYPLRTDDIPDIFV